MVKEFGLGRVSSKDWSLQELPSLQLKDIVEFCKEANVQDGSVEFKLKCECFSKTSEIYFEIWASSLRCMLVENPLLRDGNLVLGHESIEINENGAVCMISISVSIAKAVKAIESLSKLINKTVNVWTDYRDMQINKPWEKWEMIGSFRDRALEELEAEIRPLRTDIEVEKAVHIFVGVQQILDRGARFSLVFDFPEM